MSKQRYGPRGADHFAAPAWLVAEHSTQNDHSTRSTGPLQWIVFVTRPSNTYASARYYGHRLSAHIGRSAKGTAAHTAGAHIAHSWRGPVGAESRHQLACAPVGRAPNGRPGASFSLHRDHGPDALHWGQMAHWRGVDMRSMEEDARQPWGRTAAWRVVAMCASVSDGLERAGSRAAALQLATFTWRWGSTPGRLLQWEPGAACVTSTANSGAVHASAVERRTRHTGSMSQRLMGVACGQPPATAH